MNRSQSFISILLLLVLAVSVQNCTDPPSPAEISEELKKEKYFDLKGYMDAEKKRLRDIPSFSKTVMVNGETETRELEKLNVEDELDIFSRAGINRPAWSDKYSIDSTFNASGALEELLYVSQDEDLSTRRLQVKFGQDGVRYIEIEKRSRTNVAETRELLVYEPSKGYSIESHQEVALVDPQTFRIEVSFRNQ